MNNIFVVLIYFAFFISWCLGSELALVTNEIDLDRHYFSRKAPVLNLKKPFGYQDFLDHGMLVHVGSIAPEMYDANGKLSPVPYVGSGWRMSTYWSLNGPISVGQFYYVGNSVILKRITPALLERCINFNPYEVIIPGPVILEAGDVIIAFGKYHHDGIYSRCTRSWKPFMGESNMIQFYQRMSVQLKGAGIQLIMGPHAHDVYGKGFRRYFNDQEGAPGQNQVTDCVYQILKELGCWQIELPQDFWTHNPLFKFRESPHVPGYPQFAQDLFSRYPHMSIGYEFYSSLGGASLVPSFEDIYETPRNFFYWKGFFDQIHENLMDKVSNFYTERLQKILNREKFLTAEMLVRQNRALSGVPQEQICGAEALPEGDIDYEFGVFCPLHALVKLSLPMSSEVFTEFHQMIAPYCDDQNLEVLRSIYIFTTAYRHNSTHNLSKLREKTRFLPFKIRQDIFIAATGYDFIHSDSPLTATKINVLWGW